MYVLGGLLAGLSSAGMKALVIFSIVNLSINLVQSIILLIERFPILLPEDARFIYYKSFSSTLSPREFLKIYKLAEIKKASKNELLVQQDVVFPYLLLILSGLVHIKISNKLITALSAGFFIGDNSFLTGHLTNASAITADDVTYLSWEQNILHKLEETNLPLYSKFKTAISLDLLHKIEIHSQLQGQDFVKFL